MPTYLYTLFIFLLLSTSSTANANTIQPISSTDITAEELNKYHFKQVGEARLSVLFWSIYHSSLYSLDGDFSDKQRPIKLEINYLIDIKSADLISKTADEWQQQGLTHANHAQWLEQLRIIWPNIKENDTLTFIVDTQNQSHFLFNQHSIGSIIDEDFADQFLAIWLSEKTSRPNLRKKLLGVSK